MLTLLIAAVAALPQSPSIQRDAYGVPLVEASSAAEAYRISGYAIAEDRLWQMENARRVARGRMAEAFGKAFAAADRETLKTAYTDEEMRAQFKTLDPSTQEAFRSYVDGVNLFIQFAKSKGDLPPGYAENNLEPAPWTLEDSLAIAILLTHQFGRFGAGELRNLALLAYLDGQPKAKDRKLDILDDFLWQNDPQAVPTVSNSDDPTRKRPEIFPPFDRKTTEAHLAMLPKMSLFELLPGMRLAERTEGRRVAEMRAAPHKAGSYAIVVGKARSNSGHPVLLSAPQMGFTNPSIVHEISIKAPGIDVVGIGVPGVPGVAIGATHDLAWGLTSGVADTDDVFYYPAEGMDGYKAGGVTQKLSRVVRTIKVKGEADQEAERLDTIHGPVVLKSRQGYFVRRSPSRGAELRMNDALYGLYSANTANEVEASISRSTMNFNFFYATADGDIGYRYVGLVPLRASGLDPRFPTPSDSKYDWRGMVPADQMPRVRNPEGGVLANWNNKPAAWWPNGDAPVWSRAFRNTELIAAIPDERKLTGADVELAAWTVARRDERFRWLGKALVDGKWPATIEGVGNPEFALAQFKGYDGWFLAGSGGALLFNAWIAALREELFASTTGAFVNPELFELAASPGVMLAALENRTKVDYLAGRSAAEVAGKAAERALQTLAKQRGSDPFGWSLVPAPAFEAPGEQPAPYRRRGTYTQIVEIGPWGARGRNLVAPGQAERGAHAMDQMALAREWRYKPMRALNR